MAHINHLQKIKEAELLDRLSRKEEDIKKRDFEKGCDKQIENRILEEANAIKQEKYFDKTHSNRWRCSRNECGVPGAQTAAGHGNYRL